MNYLRTVISLADGPVYGGGNFIGGAGDAVIAVIIAVV